MKKQKGFTLVELLVVIAIIGLLSTLAVVSLNNARLKSRDAKRVSDIKQIQTAMELFFNDCGRYPSALATTANDGCPSGTTFGTFMALIPAPPSPNDGTSCGQLASYTFANSTGGTTYTLNFCLGGATGSLPAGLRTATPSGIQ